MEFPALKQRSAPIARIDNMEMKMGFRKILWQLLFASIALTGAHTAFAHEIDCTPNYSDSRCMTPIRSSPIPSPKCSTAAGWTTAAAAVWQGSHWSQPMCSYQAPPTCPSGYTQTSAPVWNGSSWSTLRCRLTYTPPPQPDKPTGFTPGTHDVVCENIVNQIVTKYSGYAWTAGSASQLPTAREYEVYENSSYGWNTNEGEDFVDGQFMIVVQGPLHFVTILSDNPPAAAVCVTSTAYPGSTESEIMFGNASNQQPGSAKAAP
jgi:hypothetical protein